MDTLKLTHTCTQTYAHAYTQTHIKGNENEDEYNRNGLTISCPIQALKNL